MSQMTTVQAAEAVGTDARTLRKFLRASAHYDAVGQGKRYEFDEADLDALSQRFKDWSKPSAPAAPSKKASSKKGKGAKGAKADPVTDDPADITAEEETELEDLDDLEELLA